MINTPNNSMYIKTCEVCAKDFHGKKRQKICKTCKSRRQMVNVFGTKEQRIRDAQLRRSLRNA